MLNLFRTIGLLFAFWLALSGKTDTLFLALGLISVLMTTLIDQRLWPANSSQISPPFRISTFVPYCGWLVKEILKSNVTVIRAALKAQPTLNPSLAKYRASSDTPLGRAILANSITLTPGTLVVEMTGPDTLVHALLDPMDDPDAFNEMDSKSARIFSPETTS